MKRGRGREKLDKALAVWMGQ